MGVRTKSRKKYPSTYYNPLLLLFFTSELTSCLRVYVTLQTRASHPVSCSCGYLFAKVIIARPDKDSFPFSNQLRVVGSQIIAPIRITHLITGLYEAWKCVCRAVAPGSCPLFNSFVSWLRQFLPQRPCKTSFAENCLILREHCGVDELRIRHPLRGQTARRLLHRWRHLVVKDAL